MEKVTQKIGLETIAESKIGIKKDEKQGLFDYCSYQDLIIPVEAFIVTHCTKNIKSLCYKRFFLFWEWCRDKTKGKETYCFISELSHEDFSVFGKRG